jgi:signal transduction histidine kinase
MLFAHPAGRERRGRAGFPVGRRSLYLLCIVLLAGAWGLDVISPQQFVVAILLSVPIALSSISLNRRFTLALVLLALVADASAGWYNAFQDHYRWDPIAVADRLLAALSIALVGLLSVSAQQQALHAGELAERQARSEVLRDLIYALSHDLRTPLTAARMTMRQALGGAYGELPAQYREILVRSIASNEELNRLAETLLLVARYESGEQSPLREPVEVADVARAVAKELEPLALSKGITLSAKMPQGSVYVLGDETELRRAITNLLANAVTWTPQNGKISLILQREDGDAIVTVEDDGYGVPALTRENLFQRFAGRSRQGAGSGLGLYIVRRIAEGHDGSVQYRPAAPRGSIFTLRLPRIPEIAQRA